MDSLVALGSGVSFIYSLVITVEIIVYTINKDFAMSAHHAHDLYFEGAAMIVTLITVGKTLESYSKGRTTDAINALMALAPETATVLVDGKEQVVLEQIINTEWHSESNLAEFQNAVDFRKNKKLGFLELYRHYMAMMDVLRCAGITGEFKENGLTPEERRILLTELNRLEQHLADITSKAKQESILSAQVDLNMQAAQIKQAITQTKERLNHHG